MNNIILGGGIAGLFALNIVPESTLIEGTDKLAADFIDNTFPKYIHDTPEVQPFAEGIKREDFDIAILYDGYFINFFDNTSLEKKVEVLEAYCIKKYGDYAANTLLDKMNGYASGKYMRQFVGDKNELIKRLVGKKHNVELLRRITFIDTVNKSVVTDTKEFHYDNLISTLPVNVFASLSHIKIKVKPLNIAVIRVKYEGEFGICKHFIYAVDEGYHFHRINVNRDTSELIFEMDIGHEDDIRTCFDFMSIYNIKHGKFKFQKYKLPVTDELPEIENVYFLGRSAVGDYSIKIEDIIKHARQIEADIRDSKANQ
jgi:hypothetical protein